LLKKTIGQEFRICLSRRDEALLKWEPTVVEYVKGPKEKPEKMPKREAGEMSKGEAGTDA